MHAVVAIKSDNVLTVAIAACCNADKVVKSLILMTVFTARMLLARIKEMMSDTTVVFRSDFT